MWGQVHCVCDGDFDVFVNGGYARPAGRTNRTIWVEFGKTLCETTDGSGKPDRRCELVVERMHPPYVVALSAVSP